VALFGSFDPRGGDIIEDPYYGDVSDFEQGRGGGASRPRWRQQAPFDLFFVVFAPFSWATGSLPTVPAQFGRVPEKAQPCV